MGPGVKERVALLSISLKFTLLFTLPEAPAPRAEEAILWSKKSM